MANYFDQFDDAQSASKAGAGGGGNYFDQFDEQPASFTRSAIDVAKQIPSGLVAGTEAIATFPAQAAGFLGGLAEKIPGMAPSPEQAADRAKLMELIKAQRGEGISQYLPKPETTAGQFARTGAEFVPAAVAGSTFAIPRAIGVGATTGLVSEGLGQAAGAVAPELEPYARVGGALVAGPLAGRLAQGAAVKSATTSAREATEAAANRGYQQFRAANLSLDPTAAQHYTTPLKAELSAGGWTPRTAGKTWEILDDIERTPFTTPAEFQARYKELGSAARKATDSEERMAASIAQERLLNYLESPPSWVVRGGDPAQGAALLRDANANWAAAKRAENVSGRIEKAEQVASGQYSGLGLENELRRRMGILGLSPEATGGKAARGFTEEERQAFKQFGEGTPLQNLRRYATGALSGRGGIGVTGVGGILGTAGGYFGGGDPLIGGAVGVGAPLLGLTLAKLGNRSALNRARELELRLLSRSPYAAQAGVPGVRSGGALSTLAPSLATIGQ